MNLHAEPVSQPVIKKTAETGLLDHRAGFGIDSWAMAPGRIAAIARSWARGRSDRSSRTGSDLTGDENSRQVTFIGAAGCSPVDQHEIIVADPRRRRSVWHGAKPSERPRRRSAENSTRWRRNAASRPQGIGDVLLGVSDPHSGPKHCECRSAERIASRISAISASSLTRRSLDPSLTAIIDVLRAVHGEETQTRPRCTLRPQCNIPRSH